MAREIEQMLSVGSKYRVISLQSHEKPLKTCGEFMGYAAFSNETAICIKMDEKHGKDAGITRVIPYHALLSIDVLEYKEKKEEARPSEDSKIYYR